MFELKYNEKDLVEGEEDRFQFDEKLLTVWNTYMQAGYFRYGLEGIQNRVLEGR